MIIKYNKNKLYEPNALKNKVRRMARVAADRTYQHRIESNPIFAFLLKMPIVKQTLQFSLRLSKKLLGASERLRLKGENHGISESRQTSSR